MANEVNSQHSILSRKRALLVSIGLLAFTLALAATYVATKGENVEQPEGWSIAYRVPQGFVPYSRHAGALNERATFEAYVYDSVRSTLPPATLSYWNIVQQAPDFSTRELSTVVLGEDVTVPILPPVGDGTDRSGRAGSGALGPWQAEEIRAAGRHAVLRIATRPDGQAYIVALTLKPGGRLDEHALAAFETACTGIVAVDAEDPDQP